MKKVARLLVLLAAMMVVMGLVLSCTIQDENGNPVDSGQTPDNPGIPSGPGYEPGYTPPADAVPLIVLEPDGNYAKPNTDFTVRLTLLADTAAGASKIHGDTIAIYLGTPDANDAEALLISPTLIVITGGFASNSNADKILVTNARGEASVTFKTPAEGVVMVTFRYKGQNATLRIPVSTTPPPPPVPLIRIDTDSNYVKPGEELNINLSLFADTAIGALPVRGDTIIVVKDANAMDDTLYVAVDTSLIVIQGGIAGERLITDIQGRASLKFSSPRAGIYSLTFRYKGHDATMQIRVSSIPPVAKKNISVSASPTVLAADGTSKSIISVLVRDSLHNPCVNDTVTFEATAGVITAQAITDEDGRATVMLTSETRNELATVKAFPKNSPDVVGVILVEMGGVRISAVSDKQTIRPNGEDSATITARLIDAAGNAITGVPIEFKNSISGTTITANAAVTDVRGEAKAVVKRSAASNTPDSITISGAGAIYKLPIWFSNNIVTITSDRKVYEIGTKDIEFTAELRNGSNALVTNSTFDVSATMGGNIDGSNFFARTIPSASGRITFKLDAPMFQDSATIFVRAKPATGDEYTAEIYKVFFRSAPIARITVIATPKVIPWNNGRATIIATAYDHKDNPVTGALIAFNLVAAPGGGEYLDPPTAVTKANGEASVSLMAGMMPSSLGGVMIRASDMDGTVSDTAKLTITGPPRYITIRRSISELIKYPTTYGKQFSALVSDVNRNPVADGTEVTFSADITGYEYYRKTARFFTKDPQSGDRSYEVGFTGVLIDNEYRGGYDPEGNPLRAFRPYPDFEDINMNGKPDGVIGGISGLPESCFYTSNGRKLLSLACNNPVEPCDPEDPLWSMDFNGMDTIGWNVGEPVCKPITEPSGDVIDKITSSIRDTTYPYYVTRIDTIKLGGKLDTLFCGYRTVVITEDISVDPPVSDTTYTDLYCETINAPPNAGGDPDTIVRKSVVQYIVKEQYIAFDTTWKAGPPAGTIVCDEPERTPIVTTPGNCRLWADYNGNNQWDWEEPFRVPLTQAERRAIYASDPFAVDPTPYWDIDWNRNGVPDPATTVLVQRTVLTKDGIADNELIYGQSDALRIVVRLTAEAKGFVAASPEEFLLPLAKDDEEYWNPFRP